jgi:DNA-binding response OmpR family regulator
VVRLRRTREGQGLSRVVLAARPTLARMFAPALRAKGFTVAVAGSAEGALCAGSEAARVLYVLDPLLPGMMGVDGAFHSLLRGPRVNRFVLLKPPKAHRVEEELLGWMADGWVRRPRCARSAREIAAELRTAWGCST